MIDDFDVLGETARRIRVRVLDEIFVTGKGHIGGCLSCVDILVALYHGGIFRRGRDHFIMGKGHAATALYVVLRDLGYFVGDEPESFCSHPVRFDPRYQGPRRGIPGVDATTGSLGHGVGLGVGWALADKLAERDSRTFVLIGDGDLFEGSTFEALRMAVEYRLANLCVIVDSNGETASRKAMCDWQVNMVSATGIRNRVIPGNIIGELFDKLSLSIKPFSPVVNLCLTMKGRGVSFMEKHPLHWHHRVPNAEEYDAARKELLGE